MQGIVGNVREVPDGQGDLRGDDVDIILTRIDVGERDRIRPLPGPKACADDEGASDEGAGGGRSAHPDRPGERYGRQGSADLRAHASGGRGADRRRAAAGDPGEGIELTGTFTAAVNAAGYTGDIEVEIFNQRVWDIDPDVVLATMTERYTALIPTG